MGKYSIFGALLFSLSLTAIGETKIPVTVKATNRVTIETQIIETDLYVIGDITMSQNGVFYVPPRDGLRTSVSSLDQLVCQTVSPHLLATHSKRDAVAYSALIGKSILYSNDFYRYEPMKWDKGIRPVVNEVTVPEDPDAFFGEQKNEILHRWGLPIHPKNLNEAKNYLVIGHITSVSCQRYVPNP